MRQKVSDPVLQNILFLKGHYIPELVKISIHMCNKGTIRYSVSILTSFIQPSVQDAVLDLHVPGEVPLQRELAGTVEAFEGLAV